MPSVTISKNGEVKSPVATKIILTGSENVEIKLEKAIIVTAKQSSCVILLSEHYLKNKDKYGELDQFIEYISRNFTQVNLYTQKGIILGTEVHTRFTNKLKKHIQTLILVDWHQKHGVLKGL